VEIIIILYLKGEGLIIGNSSLLHSNKTKIVDLRLAEGGSRIFEFCFAL